jgi:hypothetical protein
MGDQAERVVLEAEDQVSPVVDKANAGLDSFEKKAESAHGKVIRITDQTRSSVQRLIASLEKQADIYGKSGVERLISQRDQLLQRYAKEPAAIDAITRSYEKMIAVEEKAAREAAMAKAAKEAEEALRKQSESIKSFGERIGQFIENPLQGAKGAVGSFLTTLGPFGVGVMAGATALGGFAVAAFEAAKSLGEYGTRVKDAELRTGLTAREVGQFSFAAKAVGQDISVVERLMRGLSQAADENSREGEKARATLQRMGIDLRTAAGEMKPTAQILVEISEGLNKLPEGLQRDAAAMELFKRVGIEAIPFMTELNENLRIAHEQGFGPTEEDVHRFQEYQREVAVLETRWDRLIRKFKEGIVITVSWVGKGVDWFLNNVGTAGDDERARHEEEQARQDAAAIRAAGGYGASMSRSAHRRELADLERRAPGIMQNRDAIEGQIADLRTRQQNLVGNFGWVQMLAPTEEEVGRMRQAADLQKQIEQLQHELDSAQQATHRMDLRAGKEESDRLRARFFGTHEGMEKAYSDAKKDIEKYQKELFEPEHPLTKTEVTDLAGKLHTAQATEARWKAALDAEKNQSEQLKQFRREAESFVKKGEESELDAIGKIYYQRDLLLKQAAQVKASEAEIAAIRKAADEQAAPLAKKATEEFEKYDQQRRADQSKRVMSLFLPSKEQLKDWEDVFKAQERIEDIGVQAQGEELRRRASRAQRMAGLTSQEPVRPMSESERREVAARREWAAAQQAYQTRVDLAIQLAQIEVARIDREENAARKMVLAAEAQKQLYTDLSAAQDELDEKRAQAEQKRTEEVQRQVDEIQKVSTGLFHSLFTKPGDFPKQLGSTIRNATLKPIEEGLGGIMASALHPLIYGQGGIASILGGAFGGPKQDPVTITADNTSATIQNSRAIWLLTAVLSEYMGRSVPALTTQGGAMPNIGVASPSGFLSQMLRNTGGLPRFAEGGIATGPSLVGENGPELVIPLNRLRNMGLPPNVNLVGHYGPETDAALEKATVGLFNIALPAGLSALGGPAGISVGETFMALLTGAVAAATPERHDGVMLGMVPMGPPGAAQYSALTDRQKVSQLIRLAKMVEVSERPSQVLEYPGGKILLAPQQRFAMPGANNEVWGEGLIRDVYNAGKPAYKQRISTLGIPKDQRGQGVGQALYLAAMKHGPINWEEPFESLKLTEESSQVRAALVRKGLAEREGDWMRLTDWARELLGLGPTSGSASMRAPRDLEYMRTPKAGPRGVSDPESDWYWMEGGRDTWGQTREQRQAAGRKGGIKSGETRRANPKDPDLDMFGNYIGPPVDAPESVHQASASIDAVAPHLKNIDWTRKAGQIKNRVLVGGDAMSLVQAGKRLGVSSMSLERELRARYPGQDWSTIDLQDVIGEWSLKSVGGRKAYRIPKHEEGGTIATTGPAIVHAGEAIVPHADTLKRSIDALTIELHSNTGVLGWFANSMIQPMLGGRAPALPIRVPGVGTLSIPPLFGGGSETASASTIIYAPMPVSSVPTGGAAAEGGYTPAPWASTPAGGYSPAPWAGGGQGSSWNPVALANMASGKGTVPGSTFNPHAMLANLKNTDWGGFTKNDKGQITGMHGVAGAAVFTGGTMAAERGLLGSDRGTWAGVGEGAAGGAAVGFTMGGPLGALIGGVAGFGIGLGEKLAGVESPEAHASKLIKQVYGVDIPKNSGTVKQVVAIAQQEFGGQISVAVRSPGVRQLVMLYSEATGQKMPLSAATPYGGSLAEVGGNLYQQASFQNNQWHTYQSGIPTLGGITGTPYPTPGGPSTSAGMGGTTIALNINGTPITPEFVMDQSMAAQGTSYGRTQQAANMQVPGLMVA